MRLCDCDLDGKTDKIQISCAATLLVFRHLPTMVAKRYLTSSARVASSLVASFDTCTSLPWLPDIKAASLIFARAALLWWVILFLNLFAYPHLTHICTEFMLVPVLLDLDTNA
ncbi:unnamed protein product [Protopolystoma xenopodis]|uniref:Uncharacterized protein n=1 Tax=Protopolystoma xenopodis TaxID=117903 RepID=A0A3S5CME8_9PLAT|nr:unnamed protein product [Protopolystoma xenopodis]